MARRRRKRRNRRPARSGRYKRRTRRARMNNPRRRRRRKNRGRARVRSRRFRRNPARAMTASFGKAFDRKNLMDAGLIVGGGLANVTLTSIASGAITRMVPAVAKIPGYKYIAGLLGAAGVAMIGGMVVPRYSKELFIGALAQPVGLFAKDVMEGNLGLSDYLIQPQITAATQLRGLDDYLIQPQITAATQLRGMSGMSGLSQIEYEDEGCF